MASSICEQKNLERIDAILSEKNVEKGCEAIGESRICK